MSLELKPGELLSESDLSEKLNMFCSDPSMVQSLKNGADDFILSKYSWNDVAMKTLNLYQKVIEVQRKDGK